MGTCAITIEYYIIRETHHGKGVTMPGMPRKAVKKAMPSKKAVPSTNAKGTPAAAAVAKSTAKKMPAAKKTGGGPAQKVTKKSGKGLGKGMQQGGHSK